MCAAIAIPLGLWMAVSGLVGLLGAPTPDPIPLRPAAVATPFRFPTVPPIRATPPFVSTEATPFFFSRWHWHTLMQSGYLEPPPNQDVGF